VTRAPVDVATLHELRDLIFGRLRWYNDNHVIACLDQVAADLGLNPELVKQVDADRRWGEEYTISELADRMHLHRSRIQHIISEHEIQPVGEGRARNGRKVALYDFGELWAAYNPPRVYHEPTGLTITPAQKTACEWAVALYARFGEALAGMLSVDQQTVHRWLRREHFPDEKAIPGIRRLVRQVYREKCARR